MRIFLLAAVGAVALAGAAQAQTGAEIFQRCAGCHSLAAGVMDTPGPNLVGVIGRKAGSQPGASDAMKAAGDKGLVWSEATLDKFLDDPYTAVPDNGMEFSGLERPQDRKAVLDYIKSAPH